jgi:hypothetical protein
MSHKELSCRRAFAREHQPNESSFAKDVLWCAAGFLSFKDCGHIAAGYRFNCRQRIGAPRNTNNH